VKLPENFPFKRIILAVALSLLVHSLLLWQWPEFKFAENIELPPLQVKLEPLPKLARKPVVRKPASKLHIPPQPIAEPVAAAPAMSDAAASTVIAASAVAETEITPPAPTTTDETSSHPLLPKHAQLTFAVQYGSGTFKVGEVVHRLDITDGHYALHSATQTTGLVSLFKHYSFKQSSSGSVTKQGLRPDTYTEEKTDGGRKQTSTARFDWDARKAYFSNGKTSRLREQAQDMLSLPYHLTQQPLNVVSIPVALSYNNSVNQYYIAVGEEVTISTAMGELRAIPLSKVHGANEEGLIMWLALEYRLLPVKILYLDKSGEVSANMVITDIRVSDE
jgi:hypothetical protein